jgi:hypothetical protein
MPDKLLLHPTSCAQWHALLSEAQHTSSIKLCEDLESYLVFLLMRFSAQPEVAKSVVGLEFLHCAEKSFAQQSPALKEVGDKCLLFSGLFPGRAHQRRVDLNYFIQIGQTAYHTVAEQFATEAKLFSKLCHSFPIMIDVLHATRELNSQPLDLLQIVEHWQTQNSQYAFQRLDENIDGLPYFEPANPRNPKH